MSRKSTARQVTWFTSAQQPKRIRQPKWTDDALAEFQKELKHTRELLGFSYGSMGRALDCSGTYVKILEGDGTIQRQPSPKIVARLNDLKAAPVVVVVANAKEAKKREGPAVTANDAQQIAEIWNHILVRRFRCPECWNEHRRGERPKALCYWWHPSRKHCPEHGRRKAKR